MAKHAFNHLVLLIGTNPLPNYVVADYLLAENSKLETIWLICSESGDHQAGTREQADRLETLLRERWGGGSPAIRFPLEKIPLSNVSLASSIQNDVGRNLVDRLKSGDSVHLNYTGGTKSMSTHVYWILKTLEHVETRFSYLDARNFELVSDEEGVIERDLRRKISLSFHEMIRLHGFERKNKPSDFMFEDCMEIFQELIETESLNLLYGPAGYDRNLFLKEKGGLAQRIQDLTQSNWELLQLFSPNKTFHKIIQKAPEPYRIFDQNGCFNDTTEKRKFKASVKFLDGEWLEHHVLNALKPLCDDNGVKHDHNWVIKKPEWPVNLDFELDVVLINGYQLTGISVTTETKKYLCKSKGFEIIHRTRQIGGDEAKAVLATRMNKNDRDDVQRDLEYHTGGTTGNILVLGEKDLKSGPLVEKIRRFVLSE